MRNCRTAVPVVRQFSYTRVNERRMPVRTQEFLSPSRFVYQTKDHRFGEDALQLAAFAEAEACPLVCDLGTGNGILPLWLQIDAVELQPEAAALARDAVEACGLSTRIRVLTADWEHLPGLLPRGRYDLVTCNPPYFAAGRGKLPPSEARRLARHEIRAAAYLCRSGGRFCVCYRPERLPELLSALEEAGFAQRRLHWRESPNGSPRLILCEAVRR